MTDPLALGVSPMLRKNIKQRTNHFIRMLAQNLLNILKQCVFLQPDFEQLLINCSIWIRIVN